MNTFFFDAKFQPKKKAKSEWRAHLKVVFTCIIMGGAVSKGTKRKLEQERVVADDGMHEFNVRKHQLLRLNDDLKKSRWESLNLTQLASLDEMKDIVNSVVVEEKKDDAPSRFILTSSAPPSSSSSAVTEPSRHPSGQTVDRNRLNSPTTMLMYLLLLSQPPAENIPKSLPPKLPTAFPMPPLLTSSVDSETWHALIAVFWCLRPETCHRVFMHHFVQNDEIPEEASIFIRSPLFGQAMRDKNIHKTLLFLCLSVSAGREDILRWYFTSCCSSMDLPSRARIVINYALMCGKRELACYLSLCFFGANLYNDSPEVCQRVSLRLPSVTTRHALLGPEDRATYSLAECHLHDLKVFRTFRDSALTSCFGSTWCDYKIAMICAKLDGIDHLDQSFRLLLLFNWFEGFWQVCNRSHANGNDVTFKLTDKDIQQRVKHPCNMDVYDVCELPDDQLDLKCGEPSEFIAVPSSEMTAEIKTVCQNQPPKARMMSTRLSLVEATDYSQNSTDVLVLTEEQEKHVSNSWNIIRRLGWKWRVHQLSKAIREYYDHSVYETRVLDLERLHPTARLSAALFQSLWDIGSLNHTVEDYFEPVLAFVADRLKQHARNVGSPVDRALTSLPATAHFTKLRFLEEHGLSFTEFLAVFMHSLTYNYTEMDRALKDITEEQSNILKSIFGVHNVRSLDWIIAGKGIRCTVSKTPVVLQAKDPLKATETDEVSEPISNLYDV